MMYSDNQLPARRFPHSGWPKSLVSWIFLINGRIPRLIEIRPDDYLLTLKTTINEFPEPGDVIRAFAVLALFLFLATEEDVVELL